MDERGRQSGEAVGTGPAGIEAGASDPLAGLAIKDSHLEAVLRGSEFLLLDGAMGTVLQQQGLITDGKLPDLLCLEAPEAIAGIHAAYVAAGAEVATTNTFCANRQKLGSSAGVDEVFAAAIGCARKAGARYVGADIGPTGEMFEPFGTMSFEMAYTLFAEQVAAAREGGADLIVIETMTDLLEAKAAVLAAKENCKLPIIASMSFAEGGRTFLGVGPESAAITLGALGAHVVMANCSLGPDELLPVVEALAAHARCPVGVRPNAGLPHVEDGRTVYDVDPDAFAQAMGRMLACGINIVGGCCGTGPAYTQALKALIEGKAPAPRVLPQAFAVTSARKAVTAEPGAARILVVGDRINPSGKPLLERALQAGDFGYLVDEASAQQDAGAQIIDVNVHACEVDEAAALAAAARQLQAAIAAPLQIDSTSAAAIEAAVRVYSGKPLINSVNGSQHSLDTILPIARHYGCAVVGLALDGKGIPARAEGRAAVAARIVEAAEARGIPRQDVVIDCLATAALDESHAIEEALRTVMLVKERLGVRTMLGISNVSFGMPGRDLLNATFLAAALGAGVDCAIVDPLSERVQETLAAFRALGRQGDGSENPGAGVS